MSFVSILKGLLLSGKATEIGAIEDSLKVIDLTDREIQEKILVELKISNAIQNEVHDLKVNELDIKEK